MKTVSKLFSKIAWVALVATTVSLVSFSSSSPSWAQAPKAATEEADNASDPLEPVNRFLFGFNEIFQMVILRPATGMYQQLIPPAIREAIGHMIDNLKTPVILANDVLQGEGNRAWQTTQRFVVNTTLGVGGIMDPATKMGIAKHSEDFGQTLAVWGVGEGFYVVLPFYGPSNPRDAVGKLLVDDYFDPLGMYLDNTNQDEAKYARMAVGAVDEYGGVMDDLEQIKKTSVDYYAAIRSMYRQKRKAEIGNGTDVDLPPIPDLGLQMDNGHGTETVTTPPRPAAGDQVSQGRK
jgi:phospholipid-binding lipoprotein MlaA